MYIGSSDETVQFEQDGGTHTVGTLHIGRDIPWGGGSERDRYVLTGGTLNVQRGLVLAGDAGFDLDGCSTHMTWDGVVLDFSDGSVVGGENASLTVLGADSLVVLNPHQVAHEWFGGFTNVGWTHVGGSPLVVPDSNSHTWGGEIRERVICEGAIAAPPGKGLNLAGGLEVRPGATVDLRTGNLYVTDHDSNMAGREARLHVNQEFIGYPAGGTFTQAEGTHTADVMAIGSYAHWSSDGGTFHMDGGVLTVGTIFLGGGDEDVLGAEVEELVNGTFDLSGGVLDVGEVRMSYEQWEWCGFESVNAFHFTGGTLKAGFMNFDLDQHDGTLAPGRSVGTTTIDGSYAQYAGALAIELGGNDNSDANHPQYDVLEVAGAVYLAGDLELNWLPIPGDANSKFGGAYDVLIYGGVLFGEFADLGGNIGPNYVAGIDYGLDLGDGNSAVRVELHDLLDGDADLDGVVGRSDFHALQAGFGSPEANWFDGDFNFDGCVDFRDYLTWKAHVGDAAGGGEIPEPTCAALLLVGFAVAVRRRCRK